MKKFLLIALVSFIYSASLMSAQHLPTEKNIDIGRYVGRWYAVISLPQFFTRSCLGQIADYKILNEKTIWVVNTCVQKNDKLKSISGKAVVVNSDTNSELVVTFDTFWTKLLKVKGDYNIIKISEGYDTVLIGSKDRKSLWIMSRTPSIDPEIAKNYISYAKKLGFDTKKLEYSTQF